MSLFGNILWLIFGGFIAGMGYIVGGLLVCLTIIGIPFGVQSIKLGIATLAPFGKQIKIEPVGASGILQAIFNTIWVIFIGWEIALAHLASAALLAITIVGLPFAGQHIKLIPLALLPFGKSLR